MTVNKIKSVAASSTASALGPLGGSSQYLSHLVIQPGSTTPGAVTLKDGNGITLWTWPGGTLSDVKPFHVVMGLAKKAGFTITTGASVSVDAFGDFGDLT